MPSSCIFNPLGIDREWCKGDITGRFSPRGAKTKTPVWGPETKKFGISDPKKTLVNFWSPRKKSFKKTWFFNHKTVQKLIVLEVLRPREYDRTLWHPSAVLFGLYFIKFHGLGPELWRILCHEIMVLLSWSSSHDDHIMMIISWPSWHDHITDHHII